MVEEERPFTLQQSSIHLSSLIYEREIGALDHSTAALPFVSDEKNLGGPIGPLVPTPLN